MAFSGLFGKKKTKEPETRDRSSRDPARSEQSSGSSASGPARRGPNTKSPPTLSPRDVARATAEKIDLIESQIESEIMQSRSDHMAARGGVSGGSVDQDRPRTKTSIGTSTIGTSTDLMLGDSHLAHSMVLADAGNPVLEEAAILYANGQDLPAVSVLAGAVMNDKSPDTWLMLLELYQSLGKRTEFENLAIDFAVRFETSAPAWSEEQARKPRAQPTAAAPRAAIVFKGALDARIVPQLEQLKKLAQRNPVLHLEFDQVNSVDPAGADLILRVFAAFQKSNHEVAISGASQLAERLRAAIEVGRRDLSNAVWMLLLEIYRILGRQAAFEETSIDYCVTFEVSPPSWEPASPKYLVDDQIKAPIPAPAAASRRRRDPRSRRRRTGRRTGRQERRGTAAPDPVRDHARTHRRRLRAARARRLHRGRPAAQLGGRHARLAQEHRVRQRRAPRRGAVRRDGPARSRADRASQGLTSSTTRSVCGPQA